MASQGKPSFNELRKRAGKILQEPGKESLAAADTDLLHLIHEFEVRQVELELQNEELRRAKEQVEESRNRYFDLCNSAPVGYVSLNAKGLIDWTNREAERMLADTDSTLTQRAFSSLIQQEDHRLYFSCLRKVTESGSTHACEVRLSGKDLYARVEVAAYFDKTENVTKWRLVLSDVTSRKRVEEALKKARRSLDQERRLLQSMIDSARNSHLAYLDRDFNFVRVNETYAKRCGYTPDEMVGMNYFALWHEENEPIFAGVRDSGIPVEFHDYPLVFLNQPERGTNYWDLSLAPVKDPSGNIEGLVLSLFETTERKEIEEDLKKFKDIVSLTGDAISLLDKDYRYLMVNDTYKKYSGVNLVGKTVPEYLGKEVFERDIRPNFDRCLQGETIDYQGWFEYPTLGKRFVDVAYYPYRGSDNKISGIAAYIRDITERKQAEEALRESKELFEKTFISQLDAIFLLDASTPPKIIDCNPAAVNMFGYDREEMLTRTTAFLHINEGALNRFQKKLYPAVEERGFCQLSDFEMKRKGGGVFPTEHSVIPLQDDEGRRTGWVSVVRDISNRKQAEETLRRSKDELELRVRERTAELEVRAEQLSWLSLQLTLAEHRECTRIAKVLHDHLQQLLVGAKINQELSLNEIGVTPNATAERVLDLINQSIHDMRTLNAELAPPVLNSGDLSSALDWLSRWMKENQSFEVKVESEAPIVLDQKDLGVLLFQSIRELLFNVLKHSGVKSASVKMDRQDGRLHVVISDQGVGFNPECVWEHSNSGQKFGLISIRERLLHLGGRFEIESTPNAGSTISLIIPLNDESSTKLSGGNLGAAIPRTSPGQLDTERIAGKIRVLVVDDHPVMREGLSRMLNSHSDIEVVAEASDGKEAVALALKVVPDVILMDISMHNMDGLEATRIIHSELPHIRVIGLSVYDEDDQAQAMLAAGASAYRSKSGNTDSLLAAIRGKDR